MLQPEVEVDSPANLGVLEYSAQPLIEDDKKEEKLVKATANKAKKLSFAEKAKQAEEKARNKKKDNMGISEGLVDENTGGAASVSKIIQNISKNKKERKQKQEKVADVDYTAEVQ
jgi:hypothetical protein